MYNEDRINEMVEFILNTFFERTLRKCGECGKRKLRWSGIKFAAYYTREVYKCSNCGFYTQIHRPKREVVFETKEFDHGRKKSLDYHENRVKYGVEKDHVELKF